MTTTLNSTWLRSATYADGYLTLTMRGVDYTYRAPSWLPGVLAGWSAQGASVGSLWHKVRRFCERVEGAVETMDLAAALKASIAARKAA